MPTSGTSRTSAGTVWCAGLSRRPSAKLGAPGSRAFRAFRASSQGNASQAPSTAHGSSPAPACPPAAPSGKRTSAGEAATCSLSPACKGRRRWNGRTGSACGNSCRCLGAVSPLDGCRCELTDSLATEKNLTSSPQWVPTSGEYRCFHVVRRQSFCLSDA